MPTEKKTGIWLNRFSLLWTFLVVVCAAGMYTIGIRNTEYTYLRDMGAVIGGGGTSAFLFNWLLKRVTDNSITAILSEALERVVSPMRSEALRGALSSYKWFVRIERPLPTDAGQDYYIQLVSLSYTWPAVPRKIKIVCAVSSEGGALQQWANDDEKALLWKIEPSGSPLDVSDKSVFSIGMVQVNQRPLPSGAGRLVKVNGGQAKEHIIKVPSDLVGTSCKLEFDIRTRIHEARRFTSTQLYRPVIDGEFVYIIADDIEVREVSAIVSEMTPVVPNTPIGTASQIWSLSSGKRYARISFDSAMNRGSGVRFEWSGVRK